MRLIYWHSKGFVAIFRQIKVTKCGNPFQEGLIQPTLWFVRQKFKQSLFSRAQLQ